MARLTFTSKDIEMDAADAAAWDEFDRVTGARAPEDLRRIIRYQRWLIGVVLAQLGLWFGYVCIGILNGRLSSVDFPMAMTLIAGCVGAVFVFLLSWELRGPFGAIAFGFATLVPCLGLLILTMVNGYATAELKKHGLAVGLFGANPEDVRDRPGLYDIDEDSGW